MVPLSNIRVRLLSMVAWVAEHLSLLVALLSLLVDLNLTPAAESL
jgi:hypothetical protein